MKIIRYFFGYIGMLFGKSEAFCQNHAKNKANKINDIGKLMKIVGKKFNNEGYFGQAASLSYTTLFSLVPLLAVSFAVFAAFPVFKDVSAKIQQLIFENFVATSAQSIHDYLISFISQTAHLSVIGMVFLLVTAVLLVFSMESTFNAIWKVTKRRHGVAAFLLYWGIITLIPIVIAMVVMVTSSVMAFPLLEVSLVKGTVLTLLPYVTIFVAFFLLYYALPNCHVPVLSAALGGIIATLFFEIAKYGFSIYVTTFANYKLIYGALAIIPIFLLWLYIVWLIILFGAVVGCVVAKGEKAMNHEN